jgi:hypothetical protein
MYTVLVRLLIIFSVLFSSCKRSEKYYSQIILNADKVQIKKSSENFDTTIIASNSILTSFAEILKNYEGNCSCEAKDEVIFFKQGVEVLKVGINQQDKKCTFLFITEDDKKRCYRLNYRVGMMMSEINK